MVNAWYAGGMSNIKAPPLDWRDGRRQRAWELKEHGWKQTAIAAA